MPENNRANEDKNVSLASVKKGQLRRRFINLNPRYIAGTGDVGLFTAGISLEIRATEELAEINEDEVVIPVAGDFFDQYGSGINPAGAYIGRPNLRRRAKPKPKKRGGVKK